MLVLALVAWSAAVAAGGCVFPSVLTRRSRWESRISAEHRSVDLYLKFSGQRVEVIDYRVDNSLTTVHECVRGGPGGSLVLRTRDTASSSGFSYHCAQYVARSDSVVEVSRSAPSPTDTPRLCEHLDRSPWLLVWPRVDRRHPAALIGGYDMAVRDPTGHELCASAALRPRLESACAAGEGVHVDFRHFDCRGELSMEVSQRLASLGSWRDGPHAFTVLTDSNDMWPRLWLLRTPADTTATTFDARLYTAVYVDAGDTAASGDTGLAAYYSLTLTRRQWPSLCLDEAADCAPCADDQYHRQYCRLTCGLCEAQRACSFPASVQGEWKDGDTSALLAINASTLSPPALPAFRCLQLAVDEGWYRAGHLHAVAAVLHNGCRPRYACAQLRVRSDAVLQFRLSERITWPHVVTLRARDVCLPAAFSDDVRVLTSHQRSVSPKTAATGAATSRPTVNCDVTGTTEVSGRYNLSDGCAVSLDACGDGDTLSLRLRGGGSCGNRTVAVYWCIASYLEGESHVVVTEAAGCMQCWLFRSSERTGGRTLYVVPSATCSNALADSIEYHNSTHFIAAFKLSARAACVAPPSGHSVKRNESAADDQSATTARGSRLDETTTTESTGRVTHTAASPDTTDYSELEKSGDVTEWKAATTSAADNTDTTVIGSGVTTDTNTWSGTARRETTSVETTSATSATHDRWTTELPRSEETRPTASATTDAINNMTSSDEAGSPGVIKLTTSAGGMPAVTVAPPNGDNENHAGEPTLIRQDIPPADETNDTYALPLARSGQGNSRDGVAANIALIICIMVTAVHL